MEAICVKEWGGWFFLLITVAMPLSLSPLVQQAASSLHHHHHQSDSCHHPAIKEEPQDSSSTSASSVVGAASSLHVDFATLVGDLTRDLSRDLDSIGGLGVLTPSPPPPPPLSPKTEPFHPLQQLNFLPDSPQQPVDQGSTLSHHHHQQQQPPQDPSSHQPVSQALHQLSTCQPLQELTSTTPSATVSTGSTTGHSHKLVTYTISSRPHCRCGAGITHIILSYFFPIKFLFCIKHFLHTIMHPRPPGRHIGIDG